MDSRKAFIWKNSREKDSGYYNATENEDRIFGALFMAYSGLTSEDFKVNSSNT